MSPRRYAGWEPTTRYLYDDQGRLVSSSADPEWDEFDNALLDELLNWQAGVHSCGHHESEQLDPDAVFAAGYTVCKACEALQRAQVAQAETDKPAVKAGKNPDFPRRWTVLLKSRAELGRVAAEQADRKSPQQLMNEAVSKLDGGSAG